MTLKDFHAKVDAVLAQEKAAFNRFMEAANSHPFAKAGGPYVIYIEDDPEQVSLFKTMMACYSTLTVLPAFSAEDGMDLIDDYADRIKCVVMDLSLNEDDKIGVDTGMNLLSWIKSEYPELFVIVLTAHTELVGSIKSLHPDIDVYVKAIDLADIVHAIESGHRVGAA